MITLGLLPIGFAYFSTFFLNFAHDRIVGKHSDRAALVLFNGWLQHLLHQFRDLLFERGRAIFKCGFGHWRLRFRFDVE